MGFAGPDTLPLLCGPQGEFGSAMLSGSQALRLLGMRKSALSGVPWSKDVSSWIMLDYAYYADAYYIYMHI